jgi:hypothetical protein
MTAAQLPQLQLPLRKERQAMGRTNKKTLTSNEGPVPRVLIPMPVKKNSENGSDGPTDRSSK